MEGERVPLAKARALAAETVDLLSPACARIEIAGSIRRRSADCGDMEIVAVPLVETTATGLFDDEVESVDLLHRRCQELAADGTFECRADTAGRLAFGARYKRLRYRGFPLDLFVVIPPATWGVIFTLRTGPAAFSHALVTDRRYGGLLPEWARVQDGAIVHRKTREVIPTPEEEDVFRAIGQPYVEPEVRS